MSFEAQRAIFIVRSYARRIEAHQSKLCILFEFQQRSFVKKRSDYQRQLTSPVIVLTDILSTCQIGQSLSENFDPYDN